MVQEQKQTIRLDHPIYMKSDMIYYYEHRKQYCTWVCPENLNIKSRKFQLIQDSLSSTWSALTTLDMEHYVISKYTFFLPLATIEITTWQDIPLIIVTITVIMIFLFQVFAPEYVCRVDTKFFKTQLAISYCMFICKYAAFSRRSNKATL